ncbi:MAG: D-alanine--D-alanine ligase, partial [Bifidobacteriaceae bacterium]|nr:D-alanine--D-alanine ligase [Bifidobacteriaceae bacterium]
GQGGEHALSALSAIGIYNNLDRSRYEVIPVAIAKSGRMFYVPDDHPFWSTDDPFPIIYDDFQAPELLISTAENSSFFYLKQGDDIQPFIRPDVAFIILHGTYGEDGSIQGLLYFSRIKYIGAKILASAICLDKELTKIILQNAGVAVTDYQMADHYDPAELRFPVFVKAATGGSSVGIERVESLEELPAAIQRVGEYDPKVLLENGVEAKEIECAVMETEQGIEVAPPGQILLNAGQWYDYDAKFVAKISTQVPADLSADQLAKCQQVAKKAFRALQLNGMARIDLFVLADSQVLVNEVNTIPGFHEISMYPKMWSQAGLSYRDLLSKLIDFRLVD